MRISKSSIQANLTVFVLCLPCLLFSGSDESYIMGPFSTPVLSPQSGSGPISWPCDLGSWMGAELCWLHTCHQLGVLNHYETISFCLGLPHPAVIPPGFILGLFFCNPIFTSSASHLAVNTGDCLFLLNPAGVSAPILWPTVTAHVYSIILLFPN